MRSFLTSTGLCFALLAGSTAVAGAQTVATSPNQAPNVATLPPSGAVGTGTGPNNQVPASTRYVGPAPGAQESAGAVPHYQTPSGWAADMAAHPYTSNMGPKPN
ncbi:MAG: hypothetical protein JO305_07120 [Alphaproteobacteria bacterium]|nr:hypothetical protein [Alphaproteobacteria bacterium]